MNTAEQQIKQLLKLADIKVNGSHPEDIIVHDPRLYARVIRQRELGFGEAYMDGWWDCKRIDILITKLLAINIRDHIRFSPQLIAMSISPYMLNQQTLNRARRNAHHHYDIGNDLYERMLDKRMVYSCGYWKDAKNLDEAQENKLDLICRKLELKKGMTLLDIGCGWGGMAEYAARKYGVIVTGISPASEQVKLARERTKGLRVKILQKDYREVTGKFDRIISVGMLEHVGPRNYKAFFTKCDQLLAPGGMMLHHFIGGNKPDRAGDPWIRKYIFPGGRLPTLGQIARATQKIFTIEDVQNFGPDYDKTLMAWYHNFIRNYHEIKDNYNERFYRMWSFYLQICAGGFRAHELQLWQVVMRRPEEAKTYIAPR